MPALHADPHAKSAAQPDPYSSANTNCNTSTHRNPDAVA